MFQISGTKTGPRRKGPRTTIRHVMRKTLLVVVFLDWLGMSSAFLPQPACSPAVFPKAQGLPSSTRSIMPDPKELHFRPAMKTERGAIQEILLGMLMNPLSIDVDNFLCVEEEGALIGFGQVWKRSGHLNFEFCAVR